MFAQCVVLTTLLVAVQCFTIQQDPGTRECTDLICPKGAFAKIAHPLVDDDKRETQCTVCSQCTENGYSVCGTPLNKHPRLRRSPYTAGCSCANFVPEGCVIRWAAQNVKSSDTEAIHVCYLSTLRTPPQPEATPNENGTLLMLEAFWERPYWKEFNLTDLFLYIEFEAPGSGNSSSLETHSMQIDMSDDSAPENTEPIPEYDPTDFFAQAAEDISEEDEPEYQPIQFNHDAFQGVNIVRFYYNVTAARPRQLNLRRDAYRIEDVSTSVSSESLIYNVEEAMDESDISDEDAEDDIDEDAEDAAVATSTKGPTTTTTAKTTTPATTEKPKQKPTVEMVNSEEFDESEEDDDDDILDEEDEEDPIDDGNTPVDDASEDDDSDDVDEDASTTEADDVETTTTYSSTESEESEEVTSTETSVEETTTGEGSTETIDDILLADDNINANETGDFFTKHLGGEWDLTRVCFVLAGVFSILLCIAACCYYYRGCCYSDQQKVVTKTSNGYEYHVTGNGQEMEPLTKAVKYGITEGSTANQHIIDENILDATIKELQGIAEAAESNHHDNPIQYHNEPDSDSSPEIQTYKQIVQRAPCLWPYRLRIDGLVGNGTFGNINRGLMIEADQPTSVNVSVLSIKKIELFNLEERKSIIKSLHNSVQAGSHPNVISLLAVQQQPDKLLVVLDDMFHPDLLAVLRESRAVRFDARVQKQVVSTLSSVHLIDIMLGCAEGCGHLIKQGITHPMLAACNVLVVGRSVKISGFALANHRLLHQKQFEARPTKQRWQAPEYHVRECADPTCGQSNVWSLGVLIWEIMALGGTPFAQYPTQEAFLSRIREKRAKLLPLEYCSAEMNQVADLCCTYDRDARPDMTDIVIKKLTNIRNGQEDPINLTVDNVEFIYPRILPSLEQIVARL